MDAAEVIAQYVRDQVAGIRTLDIGTVSSVSGSLVSVKVKHMVSGRVMEYVEVPVLPYGTGAGRLSVAPLVGDTVLIAFLMHELPPMLETAGHIPEINERIRYTNPVVLTVLDTHDDIPDLQPAPGEMLLQHRSGSYIRFGTDGSLEIGATAVDFVRLGGT